MERPDPTGSPQITGDSCRDLPGLPHAGKRARGGWQSQSAELGLQMAVTGDGGSGGMGGEQGWWVPWTPQHPSAAGSPGSPGCPGRSGCAEQGAAGTCGTQMEMLPAAPHLGFGISGAISTMSPCHTTQCGPPCLVPLQVLPPGYRAGTGGTPHKGTFGAVLCLGGSERTSDGPGVG